MQAENYGVFFYFDGEDRRLRGSQQRWMEVVGCGFTDGRLALRRKHWNQHLLDNHQTRSPSTGDITYGHQGGRMKNLANTNFCLLAIWPVIH
jgi:hypothetical protein